MPKRSLKRRRSKRVRNSRRYLKKGGGNEYSSNHCNPTTKDKYNKRNKTTLNREAGSIYCNLITNGVYPECGINIYSDSSNKYCFSSDINKTASGR